jgi:hypothetical protein
MVLMTTMMTTTILTPKGPTDRIAAILSIPKRITTSIFNNPTSQISTTRVRGDLVHSQSTTGKMTMSP